MSSDFDAQLGAVIRDARQRALLKQEELGAALKPPVDRSTIANYEAGRRSVPLKVLVQIADLLSVPLAELVPGGTPLVADPLHAEALQTIQQAFAQRPDIVHSVVEFVRLLLTEEAVCQEWRKMASPASESCESVANAQRHRTTVGNCPRSGTQRPSSCCASTLR